MYVKYIISVWQKEEMALNEGICWYITADAARDLALETGFDLLIQYAFAPSTHHLLKSNASPDSNQQSIFQHDSCQSQCGSFGK